MNAVAGRRRLDGVVPIVPTPFTDSGDLDLGSLRRLVEYLIGAGVQGLAVLGVASEVYSLDDDERISVIATAVEQAAGRVPVIAGSSHNSGEAAARSAREAVVAGAEVLLVMPPFFVKPTPRALADYYRTIASAVEAPIMIQDNPGWTGVPFPLETYRELAEVASITYAKVEVAHPPGKVRELRRTFGDRFTLFGGQAGNFLLEEMRGGTVGTMPAAIMPQVYVQVWELWRAGNQDAARAIFNRYHPAIRVTAQQAVGFAMVKHLLWRLGVIASPRVRNPMSQLSAADTEDLDAVVDDLNLLTVMQAGLGPAKGPAYEVPGSVAAADRGFGKGHHGPRVFLVLPQDTRETEPAGLRSALSGLATLLVGRTAHDLRAAGPVDAILTWRGGNPRPLLEKVGILPELRWIHHSEIGVDQFLFPALVESAVVVTNMRGGEWYARPIAEYVLALMLTFARRLPEIAANQRGRRWQRLTGRELHGLTLGVVGLGTIGSALTRLGLGLEMKVKACRRDVDRGAPAGVELYRPDQVEDILALSDFVALTVPRTAQTRGLISAPRLALMKPTAVLINVGRAGLVDEPALVAALREEKLAAAALDVFESEPLDSSSPLWTTPNLFVSPHMSAAVEGSPVNEIAGFLENLERFVAGQPLRRVVDKQLGY